MQIYVYMLSIFFLRIWIGISIRFQKFLSPAKKESGFHSVVRRNFDGQQIRMVKCFGALHRYYFCLTDLLTISAQPISLFSRFRKWKEFIWNGDCGKSRFIRFIHQENGLTGAGRHAHTTANAVCHFIHRREGCNVLSNLDAMLRTCILTRITRNIQLDS